MRKLQDFLRPFPLLLMAYERGGPIINLIITAVLFKPKVGVSKEIQNKQSAPLALACRFEGTVKMETSPRQPEEAMLKATAQKLQCLLLTHDIRDVVVYYIQQCLKGPEYASMLPTVLWFDFLSTSEDSFEADKTLHSISTQTTIDNPLYHLHTQWRSEMHLTQWLELFLLLNTVRDGTLTVGRLEQNPNTLGLFHQYEGTVFCFW